VFLGAGSEFNPIEHLYDRYTVWVSYWGAHGGEFIKGWNDTMPGFMAISQHVIMMWIAAAIMLAGFSYVTYARNSRVPRGLRNFLEPIVTYFRDEVVRPSIPNPHFHHHAATEPGTDAHGEHGHDKKPEYWLADKFVPFFVCMFCFLALLNLMGLIPGSTTATSAIQVTAYMALITLTIYVIGAIWMSIVVEGGVAAGLVGFVRNMVPYKFSWNPMDMGIWFLLLLIEIAGFLLIKPFALAVRLFANMTGGHCSLLSFLFINMLIPDTMPGWRIATGIPTVLMGVGLYGLEIFVGILQAYIFTYLSAMFVGMYLVPEH
jgi:F-type H+-transporting ATPase subunit a